MKISKVSNYKSCPKCKQDDMVLAMKTGNINIFGCLRCRNAQGMHLKAKDAKEAWKAYVEKESN